MRKKPDLTILNERDPNDFLESATADQLEISPKNTKDVRKKSQKMIQKAFRLPVDLANALKLKSAKLTTKTGERVTEAKIVEDALRYYLDNKLAN
jgi:hypothetical protein